MLRPRAVTAPPTLHRLPAQHVPHCPTPLESVSRHNQQQLNRTTVKNSIQKRRKVQDAFVSHRKIQKPRKVKRWVLGREKGERWEEGIPQRKAPPQPESCSDSSDPLWRKPRGWPLKAWVKTLPSLTNTSKGCSWATSNPASTAATDLAQPIQRDASHFCKVSEDRATA